ncbi:MAG: DUF4197 domain-containing protein [Candidatus Tectimicrobiota bacterium]
MRIRLSTLLIVLLLWVLPATAQQRHGGLSDLNIGAGLKEALRIGTENTVRLTGKPDGYFRNQAIKILLPRQLQGLETGLRALGLGAQVDELVLSMNRAAERAAPLAGPIFLDAITAMTFEDVRQILNGGATSATRYFQSKTSDSLSTAFRPVVEQAMNEVGVMRQYNQLLGRYQALPLTKSLGFDLESYVVSKALDGLFRVLGEEERKIRTNPTARVTSLLQQVFGK